MEVFIKASLLIIFLKDKESNFGLMEQRTMEVIEMELNTEEEYIISQTDNSMTAIGKTVENMEKAS